MTAGYWNKTSIQWYPRKLSIFQFVSVLTKLVSSFSKWSLINRSHNVTISIENKLDQEYNFF